MQRPAAGGQCRLADRLAQGGMGVDGGNELVCITALYFPNLGCRQDKELALLWSPADGTVGSVWAAFLPRARENASADYRLRLSSLDGWRPLASARQLACYGYGKQPLALQAMHSTGGMNGCILRI